MILEQFSLGKRVALVTGAGRGLGQGMALALAEAGADVAAVDVIDCADTAAAPRRRSARWAGGANRSRRT